MNALASRQVSGFSLNFVYGGGDALRQSLRAGFGLSIQDGQQAELARMIDREEFERALRPVLPLAYRYCLNLCGNSDDAMELVQEASISAFRAFHQFESGTNFKAWLLKILTNQFLMSRRAQSRQPAQSIEEVPELYLYRQARRFGVSTKVDPFELLLDKVDGLAVRHAMSKLPDEYVVVAVLHFLSESSYDDCAQTLDIPIGTVRSRLHRARRLLQASLWQIAEERGYLPNEVAR